MPKNQSVQVVTATKLQKRFQQHDKVYNESPWLYWRNATSSLWESGRSPSCQ